MNTNNPNIRWCYLSAHIFALFVGTGLFLNWTPLSIYLKNQGLYLYKCVDDRNQLITNCEARDTALAYLPIYAISASFSFALIGGLLRDAFGSRCTFTVASLLITTSMLSILLNTRGSPYSPPKYGDLLPLSFVCWGASAEMLTISLIGVAEHFPSKKSFIMTLISAVRSVFMVNSYFLKQWSPSLKTFLIGYSSLSLVWLVFFTRSDFFAPDQFIPHTSPKASLQKSLPKNDDLREALVNRNETETQPVESIGKYILAFKFTFLVAYYMIFTTIFNYCVAILPIIYRNNPDMLNKVGLVIPVSGLIGAPLLGYIADKVSPLTVAFNESVAAIIILLGTALFPNSEVAGFLILWAIMFYYSCPCGQVYIVVCNKYPISSHGTLCGITFLCGGICSTISTFFVKSSTNAIANGMNFELSEMHYNMVICLILSLSMLIGGNIDTTKQSLSIEPQCSIATGGIEHSIPGQLDAAQSAIHEQAKTINKERILIC